MSSVQDQQRVFHTYKAVFQGPNSQIRKKKRIRTLIRSQDGPCRSLCKELGDEKVLNALLILLHRGAFQSETKASIAFPGLIQESGVDDSQNKPAGIDEINFEAGIFTKTVSGHGAKEEPPVQSQEKRLMNGTYIRYFHLQCLLKKELEWRLPLRKPGSEVRSPYLIFIPYRAQHLLLTATQRLLEDCCFEFAIKWLPDVLKEHMWDCPEAVELNRWIRVLLKYSGSLPQYAFDDGCGLPLKTVFLSVNMIRHSAVHRLRISAVRITEMIRSAARFAGVLRDQHRAIQLTEMQQELQGQSGKLEMWKALLRKRFAGELQDISERRAELNRMEEQAEVAVIKEDSHNRSLIGSLLEESILRILRSRETMEERPDSQPDVEGFGPRRTWEDMNTAQGNMWSIRKSRLHLHASENPPCDGIFSNECSSDEFSCDDATVEALRLAAESKSLMDV